MNYFRVSVDSNYVAPMPLGWYGILDQKSLREKKAYQMQKHFLFYVENHMQMVVTDLITFPCFLVSKMVKEIINCYDPYIKFTRIVLYDRQKKQSMAYYLPFLSRLKVREEGKEKGKEEEKEQKKVILIEKKQWNHPVIWEGITTTHSSLLMRMDLLESILRRGAVGIGAEEATIKI